MSTPTPRTDAAWASSFEECEYRAAHTARTMRECSQQLETELAALTAERDQLRAALALGQQNCDDAYDDLRDERDAANARAERAEAELAAERARLDWLESPAGFDWQWNSAHSVIVGRAAIDTAMKEGAK